MKTNINIFDAEQKVREMANNEMIEDRIYELAQELTEGYICRIHANNEVLDADGNPCDMLNPDRDGSMWYDEVRDDAMRILFEKMGEFFRQ